MSQITVLYGVFGGDYPESVKMKDATPQQILVRIQINRRFRDQLKNGIKKPRPSSNTPEYLNLLIDETNEEIEELFDYYKAKIKASK